MRLSEAIFSKRLCQLLILLFTLVQLCPAVTDPNKLPAPTGYVSDLAGVVNASDKEQLEAFCTRVDHELGVQFALVTVDTVGDASIRDFALELARHWGVGDKKNNEGVLLLLATKDHKSDIETGRGTEPYLTDGFSGGTLRSMRPQLRANEYGPALLAGAQEMARQIAQGKNIAFTVDSAQAPPDLGPRDVDRRDVPQPRRRSGGGGLSIFVLIIFVLLWLFGRGGRRGGGGRYGGGGGGGFLTGMLLGNMLGGRGYGGGGNWGSSGGFGGGDSGGSGGFGGFGGGDFGGGGASSDW